MTCYEPGRSETLFFGLNPKGAKFLEALNLWVRCRRRFFFFHRKGAPYFWKPLTCGYVAAGAFFFPAKRPPYFWKPLTCGYVAAGAFFFPQKKPDISGSPWLVGTLPQAPFFPTKKGPIVLGTDPPDLGTDHEGTARKYLAQHGIMRARHGNIWHGTDPPDLGTARHGTSLSSPASGNLGFSPFGIGFEKQGFRMAWDITSQKFQGVGLKLKAFILTFRDPSSHLCQS